MQFSNLFSLAALATAASAVTVSYDTSYDSSSGSLSTTACSDGDNGLETTQGWSTFGQIPHFPDIAGAAAVAGWNSAQCGTCWQLTYKGRSVIVLAVDHTAEGFNLGTSPMNVLTNNRASEVGRVDATAVQVDVSKCGL